MHTANRYADRTQAGQALATELLRWARRPDTVALGLARGGVPVAAELARALHVEFDVFLVQKLRVPAEPEVAFGAVAPGGVRVLDSALVESLELTPDALASHVADAETELAAQTRRYWGDGAPLPLEGRRVILADDGLATGWTMRAAVAALRAQSPAQVIVAAPVGSPAACRELAEVCDRVVCPLQPEPFHAVGLWYVHFAPVTEDEVLDWLEAAHTARSHGGRVNFFR